LSQHPHDSQAPSNSSEMAAEQAYIDFAHRCLEDSRTRAQRITEIFEATRGGTNQARHERESVLQGALNRLQKLNVGNRSLVFGRIDLANSKDKYYIGRVGVWDENQRAAVVDWRAPIAEPFFRATGLEPMGLERCRHFATRGRTLLAIDDQLFGDLADPHRKTPEDIRGEGALVAALEAARSGRLGDIIATIQSEQDQIIRAPMPGLLIVQGGPGTGKTVVALHRAAYLLYTHRISLETQGVLIVAPNRLFIAYTEQVLPSLGEAGVTIAVLADLLVPRVQVDALDDEPTGRVKGDPRMLEVLAKAVADRERKLRTDQVFGFGLQRLRITVAESRAIVAQARNRNRTHNAGRKVVEGLFYETLAASGRTVIDPQLLREQLHKNLNVRLALDWMWPVLTPADLLHDLFGSRALLRSASRGVLSDAEAMRLYRPRLEHSSLVVWSFQDVALLDEARALLGHRPKRRAADAVRTYGHICIDEAQDLSPLELRMVARRSLNGSFTVVGDVAQATGAWANQDWQAVIAALRGRHEHQARVTELTVGYRICGPSMKLARRILPYAAAGLRPPRPLREDGDEPRLVQAQGSVADAVVGVLREELTAVGEGNVAVIVAGSQFVQLSDAFVEHGLEFGGPTRRGLDKQVIVVPVRLVKGLEVDAAIVVEPRRIVDEEIEGFRSLYVALTRATKRVSVVFSEVLPELLSDSAIM